MTENDTQKMLKAILLMQVEILGRLERLENADEYEMQDAERRKNKLLNKPAPDFESAHLSALIDAEALQKTADWQLIKSTLNSLVASIDHEDKSS